MRNRKSYTGKVKANKYKVVATANANQTYGAQISLLASAYSALSEDEKVKSFLLASNGNVYLPANITLGRFSIMNSQPSASLIGNIELTEGKYIYIYASNNMTWTRTDGTSSQNPYSLSLCVYN